MSRVPPHSLEMEEALIGSMLLSSTAVAAGLDLCAPDDFYKPLHAQAFTAISALAQAGSAIDPALVAQALGRPTIELLTIQGNTPASANAGHYARVVAEYGALRRTIALAGELSDAAYSKDADAIDRMLADPMATIMPNYEPITEPIEASVLASEDYAPDFVIPNCLARQEIAMWVGEPGHGKSTLLRQCGTRISSGQHPFTGVRCRPMRVLMIDAQESRGQAGLEIRKMLRIAGDDYRGMLWIEPCPQGIDLTTRRHQRWLDAKVAKVRADLVILGPLYNLVRGDPSRTKHSEETAELGMNALTDLMVRRDVALMIEAHAPHGNEMRVRGSKLWEDFPDFGFGLVPDESHKGGRAVDVVRFRGDRHHRPGWPIRYVQGLRGEWPWVALHAEDRRAV